MSKNNQQRHLNSFLILENFQVLWEWSEEKLNICLEALIQGVYLELKGQRRQVGARITVSVRLCEVTTIDVYTTKVSTDASVAQIHVICMDKKG